MPVDEALPIAEQIADALEAAHEVLDRSPTGNSTATCEHQ